MATAPPSPPPPLGGLSPGSGSACRTGTAPADDEASTLQASTQASRNRQEQNRLRGSHRRWSGSSQASVEKDSPTTWWQSEWSPSAPSSRPMYRSPRTLSMTRGLSHDCLRRLSALQECQPEFVEMLIDCVHTRTFQGGNIIVQEGDPGTTMYLLIRGQAEVIVNDQRVADLADGCIFGEMSCLGKPGSLCWATVRARTFCECRTVSREELLQALRHCPQSRKPLIEGAKRRRDELRQKGLIADPEPQEDTASRGPSRSRSGSPSPSAAWPPSALPGSRRASRENVQSAPDLLTQAASPSPSRSRSSSRPTTPQPMLPSAPAMPAVPAAPPGIYRPRRSSHEKASMVTFSDEVRSFVVEPPDFAPSSVPKVAVRPPSPEQPKASPKPPAERLTEDGRAEEVAEHPPPPPEPLASPETTLEGPTQERAEEVALQPLLPAPTPSPELAAELLPRDAEEADIFSEPSGPSLPTGTIEELWRSLEAFADSPQQPAGRSGGEERGHEVPADAPADGPPPQPSLPEPDAELPAELDAFCLEDLDTELDMERNCISPRPESSSAPSPRPPSQPVQSPPSLPISRRPQRRAATAEPQAIALVAGGVPRIPTAARTVSRRQTFHSADCGKPSSPGRSSPQSKSRRGSSHLADPGSPSSQIWRRPNISEEKPTPQPLPPDELARVLMQMPSPQQSQRRPERQAPATAQSGRASPAAPSVRAQRLSIRGLEPGRPWIPSQRRQSASGSRPISPANSGAVPSAAAAAAARGGRRHTAREICHGGGASGEGSQAAAHGLPALRAPAPSNAGAQGQRSSMQSPCGVVEERPASSLAPRRATVTATSPEPFALQAIVEAASRIVSPMPPESPVPVA